MAMYMAVHMVICTYAHMHSHAEVSFEAVAAARVHLGETAPENELFSIMVEHGRAQRTVRNSQTSPQTRLGKPAKPARNAHVGTVSYRRKQQRKLQPPLR